MMTKSLEAPQTTESKNDNVFLSKLSTQLGTLKSSRQLFKLINQEVRSYLNFKYSTVFILNGDKDAAFNYFGNEAFDNHGNPFCSCITLNKFSTDDAENTTEVSFDFDEISDKQRIEAYLKLDTNPVFVNGLILNLRNRDKVFAHWVLIAANDQPFSGKRKDLLQLISGFLSLAVLNLRSEEIINEKDAESEILQSLNIDFASIRDKNDLLKIVHYKLRKLFEFGYHWLAVINEDQATMSSFLQDSIADPEAYACYNDAINARYSINDRVFNKVLLSKEPHIFDLDQLNLRGNMPAYMQILHKSGVKKTIMIGLQVGSRIIGVWAICLIEHQQMSLKQMGIIKSISNQLSISVDNIIANMAINRKEAERELILDFSFELSLLISLYFCVLGHKGMRLRVQCTLTPRNLTARRSTTMLSSHLSLPSTPSSLRRVRDPSA